ncbi:MAG: OmpA family protein [Deltaproteobacteria bacterium]|nr:OmpA family protein [Deltaproteobacteria bacterium]
MKAKSIYLTLGAFVLFGSVSTASAQDLLPRDNGIFTYHQPPRWRESESHPIRTVAYLLHPVGWALREAVYRPWSAFAGSTTFTRSLFGFREPFDYREPLCFFDSDKFPDCRSIPPYSKIGGTGEPEVTSDDVGSLGGERQVFIPDVNFEFDKSALNDLGKGRVRQISQLLASVPNIQVVVEGHADYIGTDDYNVSLGQRRAQAVIDELVELGIDPARMSSISHGESRPIFTEEEDWARAVNRRVQFSVGGQGA